MKAFEALYLAEQGAYLFIILILSKSFIYDKAFCIVDKPLALDASHPPVKIDIFFMIFYLNNYLVTIIVTVLVPSQ